MTRKPKTRKKARSCLNVAELTSGSRYAGLQGGLSNYQIWYEYYQSLVENPPPQADPTTYRRGRIWA